jgi:hypothetical protein
MIEAMIYVPGMVLLYKLLMPFVACIVPPDRMNNAAKYIERTERRFPTKSMSNWFKAWREKKKGKRRL